jgi:hypothetical protein
MFRPISSKLIIYNILFIPTTCIYIHYYVMSQHFLLHVPACTVHPQNTHHYGHNTLRKKTSTLIRTFANWTQTVPLVKKIHVLHVVQFLHVYFINFITAWSSNFNFILFMHIHDDILYQNCIRLLRCSPWGRPLQAGTCRRIYYTQQIDIHKHLCN